jgi:hypothetical protein
MVKFGDIPDDGQTQTMPLHRLIQTQTSLTELLHVKLRTTGAVV